MSAPPAVGRVEANEDGRDFVVGDVHGEFETLQALLARLEFRPGHDRLFALGDLINRGPRSADALAWMEGGRIALSVRGNHEDALLELLNFAERNPWAPTWAIAKQLPAWFARDVPRESWPRWLAVIRSMPIAATVCTRHGPVGLVHASPTARRWDTMLEQLRAGDRYTASLAMNSIARARRYAQQAAFEGVPLGESIAGVRAVLTGHYVLDAPRVTGNVWHLDTGAGTANGRLTAARIDTDPIETVTLPTV